jgi:glycosyltransferase involved in cell wall biosynthesis
MVKKLGLIAYANDGGLGAQTRRLAQMLKPERVLVIDSSQFSKNKAQHFEWYEDYESFIVPGFPNNRQVKSFLQNLTHVFTVENLYNPGIAFWGKEQGIKVYCQVNYEFCDNLLYPWLPEPDVWLMPSHWKKDEMTELFGKDRVKYLPPPIFPEEFSRAREINLKRKGKRRFLHIIGTAAMHDRNGTLDLIDSIKHTTSDFELVIRTQHPISMDAFLDDPRVKYEMGNLKDNQDLYEDFDVMIFPRRWGGLALTVNEGMMAGLPVITSDVEPQRSWLPKHWRVRSNYVGEFFAKSKIEYSSVEHKSLALTIDAYCSMSDEELKKEKDFAVELAVKEFSPGSLLPKYLELFNDR